jgi:hypothetical protein
MTVAESDERVNEWVGAMRRAVGWARRTCGYNLGMPRRIHRHTWAVHGPVLMNTNCVIKTYDFPVCILPCSALFRSMRDFSSGVYSIYWSSRVCLQLLMYRGCRCC